MTKNTSGGDRAKSSVPRAGDNAVRDEAAASCRKALSTKNDSHPPSWAEHEPSHPIAGRRKAQRNRGAAGSIGHFALAKHIRKGIIETLRTCGPLQHLQSESANFAKKFQMKNFAAHSSLLKSAERRRTAVANPS
jgi:hypothetical protein